VNQHPHWYLGSLQGIQWVKPRFRVQKLTEIKVVEGKPLPPKKKKGPKIWAFAQ